MGNLAEDTTVEAADRPGWYTARLSRDWEIWGPMGGYVAAIALRAAGAESPFARPASLQCHYLGVAAFDEVQLEVVSLRAGRQAASHRVSMRQGDRAILEAMVWSVADDAPGLVHDEGVPPDVPDWSALPDVAELAGPDAPPPFPFWLNFEHRPLQWRADWPPPGPLPAVWQSWLRFLAWDAAADPWLDAARTTLLVDLPSWPSGSKPHAWTEPKFTAPTLDLSVAFHRIAPEEPWLLLEGTSPVAEDALMGWTGRVWTPSGRLVASGGGQTFFRPLPG
ncbi:MAG: acyl-CoA thioesterase [Acidimicrobiales bacterium]